MTISMNVSRRTFMAGAGAAGLILGFRVPLGTGGATALARAGQTDEINAWVVVRPDETVVIRIARSEMGQGTLTGLAQLVAEKLDCDWARVTTEYPTPGTNLARGKVWKSFATGGSRAIRGSHDYVSEGRAEARPDANDGGGECLGRSGGGLHHRQGCHHPRRHGPHDDLR